MAPAWRAFDPPRVVVVIVAHDALREGRHEAVAELQAGHETIDVTGEVVVVPIPGTRNILELVGPHDGRPDGWLRVV